MILRMRHLKHRPEICAWAQMTQPLMIGIRFYADLVLSVQAHATSPTMTPNIQQLAKKKPNDDSQRPGTKVLWPKNSSWNPCCNQAAWVSTHNTRAATPSFGRWRKEDWGK